jgi:hypothetical protein
MSNLAKEHIKKIVEDYTRLYPEEFELVKQAVEMKRAMRKDDYASVSGVTGSNLLRRALYEVSVKLDAMLIEGLSIDDIKWLKSGVESNPNEGGRWFARTFQVFALPEQSHI